MVCNVYTFSRSYSESKTQGGPSVVEVLRSPPRESIRPRGVDPESVEPCGSAAVGEDVKESQKLGVDASRCGDYAGDEGEGHLPGSVGLADVFGFERKICLILQPNKADGHRVLGRGLMLASS